MELTLDPHWLLAFLLAFVRALAWLLVVPPFSNRRVIPPVASIGIASGLAVLAVPSLHSAHLPTDTAGLIGVVVLQVMTGVALGLVVQFLVSAITAAGSTVYMFGGINSPPSLDPLAENQVPVFGQFTEQVAMVLLFVTNGEMLLVRGFVGSFAASGLTLSSSGAVANVLTQDLAVFFVAALEIAAPIIVVLFATQIGLDKLAKVAPQVNVWFLGFPIQALLSLALMAVAIRVLPTYLDRLVTQALQNGAALLRGG